MNDTLVCRLKKKRLVYLHTTGGGSNISTRSIWAVEIDVNYPWAGSFTDRRDDASAFTPSLARVINGRLKKAKMTPFEMKQAPKDHDGTIWYLHHEITR